MFGSGQVAIGINSSSAAQAEQQQQQQQQLLWPSLHRCLQSTTNTSSSRPITNTPSMLTSQPQPTTSRQKSTSPRQPSRRGRGRSATTCITQLGSVSIAGVAASLGHRNLDSSSWSTAREWSRQLVGDLQQQNYHHHHHHHHHVLPNNQQLPIGTGRPSIQRKESFSNDKGTQMPDPGPSSNNGVDNDVINLVASGVFHVNGGGSCAPSPIYCQPKRAYKSLPNETEEQRLGRLAGNRERARLRRANETLEERERRLADNRERARTRRAQESDEVRFVRLADNRERARTRRALESEEQRLARLSFDRTRARERRVHESSVERDIRLADGRERGRSRWMNETEEQRRQRLLLFREKARLRRSDNPIAIKSLNDMQQNVRTTGGGRAPRGRRRVNQRSPAANNRSTIGNGHQQSFNVGSMISTNGDQEIRLVEQLLAPSSTVNTASTTASVTNTSNATVSSVAYPPNGYTGPFYSNRSDHLNNSTPCSACYPLEPFIKFNQGKPLLCEGHSRLSQGLHF